MSLFKRSGRWRNSSSMIALCHCIFQLRIGKRLRKLPQNSSSCYWHVSYFFPLQILFKLVFGINITSLPDYTDTHLCNKQCIVGTYNKWKYGRLISHSCNCSTLILSWKLLSLKHVCLSLCLIQLLTITLHSLTGRHS